MQQARYPTTISLINTASSNSRKNLHQWHRKIATSSVSKKPKTIAITSIITAISCPRNDILDIPNNSMYLHSLTSRHVNHYFRTMDDYRKPRAQEIQKNNTSYNDTINSHRTQHVHQTTPDTSPIPGTILQSSQAACQTNWTSMPSTIMIGASCPQKTKIITWYILSTVTVSSIIETTPDILANHC